MEKSNAISKLGSLVDRANALEFKTGNSQAIVKWKRDTDAAIRNIFGIDSHHIKEFESLNYSLSNIDEMDLLLILDDSDKVLNSSITFLNSMKDEVQEFWKESDGNMEDDSSANRHVELIMNRFHQVCRQLNKRYNNRPTIDINDEYDVQDLFHALLKLYFDDVRPEEYTPSYAGAASRTDFLLKKEQIIIELKKSRSGLRAKQVGEQLIVDSQRYQVHPDCKRIICFVYDPEGFIANPRGIENDLSKDTNGIPVWVFIRPEA
ncbi:hypothetical protein [Psychrobacter immobilis]|uniref:PD-(D/E)XK nuclease domain-containing protein n=1 Tax=Psychrobacter immobilis TaxID=498 RepID=UPI001D128C2B|nr:hypothetical protein [Psychrobacter immobilis]